MEFIFAEDMAQVLAAALEPSLLAAKAKTDLDPDEASDPREAGGNETPRAEA